MDFREALEQKVLIFDGAMGTSIHQYDLSLDDYRGCENCPEILVDTRPDVIAEIHEAYFKAGCDVVETDTFGGSPVVLSEFGLADMAYDLNLKAARLAVEVAAGYSTNGQKRFVSGSIGPTTKLPSLGHISFGDLRDAYYTQVAGLIDGGVDVLQFETGQDLLQAKAAIAAILKHFRKIKKELPIIVQVTIEAPPLGTMLVGSDISAALAVLNSFPVDVIGINCATGPDEMMDSVHYLCTNSPKKVSVLPNAGLPENIDGDTVYKLTPEKLTDALSYFAKEQGVSIIGGCCGTTPEHLKQVCDALGNLSPRKQPRSFAPSVASLYSAVTMCQIPAPLIVGERTNTNGSRKFKRLLEGDDLDGMVAMARAQEKEGAHILDVCAAYVGRDEIRDMSAFIKRLNTDIQIPLMVDTTEYKVLEAVLPFIAGRPIVNSINLEDGEERMLEKVALIRDFGAAAVALTIDESGMARSSEKKLAIARRIFDLATGAGLQPEDLIFDCLTFTLSTGNEDDRKLGVNTLDGIRMIKGALPGVKTILGVSNISFGFNPEIRQILNSVFLHYAVESGLDMAIVNAEKILPLFKIDETERQYHHKLIFDERTDTYDPLFTLMDFYKKQSSSDQTKPKSSIKKTIEDTLKDRIIDGNRVGLEKDLDSALKGYGPLDIINNILLEGMKVVGDLFGAGKMQLPFVLQSAETMKASVSYLEPYMDKMDGQARGTMILATVKGDVHDIGKNLVDIILSNNGYKVINLGIKQPIDNIIAAAIEHKADCIGMSGLLVKSTVIMKENLEILNQRNISIPVILGGAALTRKYVEEDCRRTYKGRLFYGQDAFADLKIMGTLKNGGRQDNLTPSPDHCRDDDEDETAGAESDRKPEPESFLDDAKPVVRSDVARLLPVPEPPFWGAEIVEDISLEEVYLYLNETVLIKGQWQVRKRDMSDMDYKELVDTKVRPALDRLKAQCIEEELLKPRAVYGYFPCQSQENDLIVYDPARDRVLVRFSFPRQNHGRGLCISDFFPSVDEGNHGVLPCQIVTVGKQASDYSQELFKKDRYTDYLYFHGLSVECAEALAEVIHKRIRKELGFGSEDALDLGKMLNQGFRGTRFSFGYPACPDLEDQNLLFKLLKPEKIGISLSAEYQLVPEQSTSAIIVTHPEAKYFNIKKPGSHLRKS